MEAEQASLTGEKEALEMEKTGIKEELVRVEQEKMDLDTEKMGRCTTHCIKAINDSHARGAWGYILDIEKMRRCTVQLPNSLHKAIINGPVGGGGYLYTCNVLVTY